MIMTAILLRSGIWSLQSQGRGSKTMATSTTRLVEMDDISCTCRSAHQPPATGFHSWEMGWQRVRKTIKKLRPKEMVAATRTRAHRLKTGVVNTRMYSKSTASLMAVLVNIHVKDAATSNWKRCQVRQNAAMIKKEHNMRLGVNPPVLTRVVPTGYTRKRDFLCH